MWDKELAALKIAARAAGGDAFKSGLPCEAPTYQRRDVEACWRLGWKAAAGKAGVWPKEALSGGGSTP